MVRTDVSDDGDIWMHNSSHILTKQSIVMTYTRNNNISAGGANRYQDILLRLIPAYLSDIWCRKNNMVQAWRRQRRGPGIGAPNSHDSMPVSMANVHSWSPARLTSPGWRNLFCAQTSVRGADQLLLRSSACATGKMAFITRDHEPSAAAWTGKYADYDARSSFRLSIKKLILYLKRLSNCHYTWLVCYI